MQQTEPIAAPQCCASDAFEVHTHPDGTIAFTARLPMRPGIYRAYGHCWLPDEPGMHIELFRFVIDGIEDA